MQSLPIPCHGAQLHAVDFQPFHVAGSCAADDVRVRRSFANGAGAGVELMLELRPTPR